MAGTLRPAVQQFDSSEPMAPRPQRKLLNLPPSDQFYYQWHPARWQVMDGELLPVLRTLAVTPGLRCVTSTGDMSLASAEAAKNDWTTIPWDAVRLTMPERRTYVSKYEGKRGPVHLSCWETPWQVGARAQTRTDHQGYRAWLRALMQRGIISPPAPEIVAGMIDFARAKVARNANQPESDLYALASRELEQLERAVEPYDREGLAFDEVAGPEES